MGNFDLKSFFTGINNQNCSISMYSMSSWPALLPEPWTSLEELHFDDVYIVNPELFKDVDLHISFPNLTLLHMHLEHYGETVLLPDLSRFEKLESITLQPFMSCGLLRLSFCPDLREKVNSIACNDVLYY